MDYTKSFQGSNACFIERSGISPLQFVQIPEGKFALILDDLPVELSMKLPRQEGEEGFWVCEMTIAYGDVIKAEAKNHSDPDKSGVKEKPKVPGELHWMCAINYEHMMKERNRRRAEREKRAAG